MAQPFPEQVSEIEARNLSLTIGGVSILERVSLTVAPGEFVSVVGGSGSGKTTLINAIAGFLPSTGELRRPPKVGVVFQDHIVFPWLTVAGNIAFGLEESDPRKRQEVVDHYLEMIEMVGRGHRYPAELSGGQVQRVGIARALAAGPDLLLMDEPYASLDIYTREKMQNWLLDVWHQARKTVLFVTHDIEEAIYLSDRVLVLANRTLAGEYPVAFARPRQEELKFRAEFVSLRKAILERMRPTAALIAPAVR